ncbi:hypothetical protein BGW36DRAFT_393125 [Talaromyces proteolyticus]|uniref:Uncharacterized protein n=1 Tax=Talaromyces proteolyticus TaxID=1131652 RepID=A0AAD4Q6P4_9EURO|nr:uncharacterized protein BGW36DRAFT_393125 [Talaromyces proteolyticus]KAH8705537.1 hypothetical protein BGW36DRAFT_393125 [Talaromyces proteolyticus]
MSPTQRMLRSLVERSVSGDADSVKTTFSSWDNCMAKAYCKWPVIAGIIIGSIIILSIAGCLISCLCCGYQCCKGCCGCCYRCCDCGGSKHNRKRDNYADQSPFYQQPPPPQPMNYGYQHPVASPAPPAYRGPRTATFDQPKAVASVNEDKLPNMPTWADAQTRRVEDHSPVHEAVEMDDLEARDHHDNPYHESPYHDNISPAAGFMSRGGYTEVPGTAASPHPSPGMYDNHHDAYLRDGYSTNSGGLRVTNASYHDLGDSEYPNHQPHSPISSPSSAPYGPAAVTAAAFPRTPSPATHAARPPARISPASYRGFENQPPPKGAPNFSGLRAYDQSPTSPRSPTSPSGFSPYEQHMSRSPPPQTVSHPTAPSYGQYRAFSPSIPSSTPPPPFSETAPDHHAQAQGGDRPPSLLMAGRRPAPGSYKAV